jgi:hypothetical protein
MANSTKAMSEGLKYNSVPDFVYYVKVDDIFEALREPGDHFWKKEDRPAHQSPQLSKSHGGCYV